MKECNVIIIIVYTLLTWRGWGMGKGVNGGGGGAIIIYSSYINTWDLRNVL